MSYGIRFLPFLLKSLGPWPNAPGSARGRGVTTSGLALLILALSGCASHQRSWLYEPNSAERSAVSLPLVLAVNNFKDERQTSNWTYLIACAVPAVPYCDTTFHRPERMRAFLSASGYSFNPSTDLAASAAEEIRRAQVFRAVYVSDEPAPKEAQLILRGEIFSTDWDSTVYTYGLSNEGELLWVFGAPIGTFTNTLEVNLILLQASNQRILWQYQVKERAKATEGYYHNYGGDFVYPKLFREGMKGAVGSLEEYVASQPRDFWLGMLPPS